MDGWTVWNGLACKVLFVREKMLTAFLQLVEEFRWLCE